jgi:hypothetical protein
MRLEDFFDLRIATLAPGEAPPPDAHLLRIEDPDERDVPRWEEQGWFHKPCSVTYALETPPTLEAYIERAFKAGARGKPRALLREVPRRYRLEIRDGADGVEEFSALYRRAIVSRSRGKDRLGERAGGFGPDWRGFYLFEGTRLAAGVLVRALRRRLSVSYGAVDADHRELDLEHFLIMQAIARAAAEGFPFVSLGRDTNRYGHHLPLGLPAYKLRLGFTPSAYAPAGRELLRVRRFDVFEKGLFFYSYRGGALEGNLFARGEADPRPYERPSAPRVRTFRIDDGA